MNKKALMRAKEKLGSWHALARVCGVAQPVAYNWYHRNKNGAPADKVLVIEEHTGISRHELRPDVFGESKKED